LEKFKKDEGYFRSKNNPRPCGEDFNPMIIKDILNMKTENESNEKYRRVLDTPTKAFQIFCEE
jgi:hypothetical protein